MQREVLKAYGRVVHLSQGGSEHVHGREEKELGEGRAGEGDAVAPTLHCQRGGSLVSPFGHSCYRNKKKKITSAGTSLGVQWLRLQASNAKGTGSIPGQGTKMPHAARHGQKTTKNKTKQSHLKTAVSLVVALLFSH